MATKTDQSDSSVEVIDRSSYEPAYAQLAGILRRQVAAGRFRPGDQLPSEAMLCQSYHVSPMTVRRTINLLAEEGVVSAVQGRGTFVKALELGQAAFDLRELQELFTDSAMAVKLLDVRIVSADERTARKLDLAVGDKAVYIRRLLTVNGQPAFYHREYLIYDPTRPIVEAETEVTALRGLFDGSGSAMLKRGELSIEACLLNKDEARILQTTLPVAAFFLEHLFYDFDDRPVSWGWFICRSDCLRFSTSIGVSDE
ncbi:MAG: GntR family transcriptional regulator [Anaerolineales bacterium]|nr:MAG: GntR family transcriptional regulator [Anaerolineales bacterium]